MGDRLVRYMLWLSLVLVPAVAWADTGLKWSQGPSFTSQNATYVAVKISDLQVLLLSKNAADGAGKTIEIRQSGDFGNSFVQTVSSANTGLAAAIPSILSAIQIPTPNRLIVAGSGGTPATSFLRGNSFSWSFPTVTIAPGGLVNTTAHSLTLNGGTLLALLQTSSGGYICRSTDNGTSYSCSQPSSFGAVAAPVAVGGTGTVQGLTVADPVNKIWLALDNSNTPWRSLDDGVTWSSGTQLSTNTTLNAILCLGIQQGTSAGCLALMASPASTQLLIYRSTDFGATWTSVMDIPRGDRVTTLLNVGGGVILALGDPSQTAIPYGYRSTDFGQHWLVVPPASIGNPLAGSSFIVNLFAAATSSGATIAAANFCTGAGTCNTQFSQAPLSTDPASPTTFGQGAPSVDANAWPVYLSDKTARQGTTTNPLMVRPSDGVNPQGTTTNPLITGPQRAATLTALADVSCGAASTLLRIGVSNRIGLLCTNNDPSVNIRVGDTTLSATKGVRLRSGASIAISGTYAVYCISEGAGVTVSCTEETP